MKGGNMFKKIVDFLIAGAAICITAGVISRFTLRPYPFGVEAQAYLQFSQGLLLFAIAIGIRELLKKKDTGE